MQGLGIAVWWLVLFAWPESRQAFIPEPPGELALLGFWLADATAASASLAAAILLRGGSRYAPAALWLAAGCMVYASLTCLGLSWLTGEAWLAVALMLPAATLSVAGAWMQTRE